MESVDSTSSAMPLMVSVHFDKWRVSLKNRPSGWSGLASTSPLRLETRNVEPSSVLIVLSLIHRSPQLRDGERDSEHGDCDRRAPRVDGVKWQARQFAQRTDAEPGHTGAGPIEGGEFSGRQGGQFRLLSAEADFRPRGHRRQPRCSNAIA